ncbi:DNA-binding response OmpR family regulator [Caulobacter ginsengisoli]|uniref:DNA-binding response OmpR family regulator n=1 Tax=Caulobacter ginsengisoli TaxID=400775 RepID=A0ABU0IY80_9CAUL|nr:response regulator [Caulobacter ginsengisoli]MDQ0466955.1 DNA-binding response OmpR family regulator [Caulobacter ginsengisoli]
MPSGAYLQLAQHPLRILFVDDDPILREFAQANLASEGTRVAVAEDGLDAFAKLDEQPADLILLDLEMPRLNGFDVLRQLRADEATSRIPVIICTSREDIAAIDKAYEAGATSFVVKPINWRLLGYQIRYVHRTTVNEAALLNDRIRIGQQSRDARTALMQVAQAGKRFLQTVLRQHPDLRTEAAEFAQAIEDAL